MLYSRPEVAMLPLLSALLALSTVRDYVVIIAGVVWVAFFVVAIVITLVLGFAAKALVDTVRRMLNEDLKPILANAGKTANTVRGTTSFISDNAVKPVVRIYGVVAGLRRAAGVLSGLSGRRKKG